MRRIAVTFVSLVVALAGAHAAGVRTWSISAPAGFAKGALDGTAIDHDGVLTLAPISDLLWGPEPGIVWDSAPAGERGAFVGLSGPARVLEVVPGAAAREWFVGLDEELVTAVARDPRGGVIIGLSPDGRVLRARSAGEAEPLVETGAKFIWALAVDEAGTLWIGTGVPGALHRQERGGELETVYETGDDAVRSIATLPGGGVLIGTGAEGRVLRVDSGDRPFVLHDGDEDEVVAIEVDTHGHAYVLAVGGVGPATPPDPTRAAKTSDNSVTVTAGPPGGEGTNGEPQEEKDARKPAPQRIVSRSTGGTLYRIESAGDVRKIWQSADEMPFDLVLDESGSVLVATGDTGRVYSVDHEGRVAIRLRLPSEQASTLTRAQDGGVIVGASGDARVVRLSSEMRREGDFVGEPIDASTLAEWGRLAWEAGAGEGNRLRFSVRAGNTEEPDDTWTDWREIEPDAAGGGGPTAVPLSRWMQVRVELRRESDVAPVVRSVELSYLARNRPPTVRGVVLEPAGVVWSPGPVPSSSNRGPVVADDPAARKAAARLRPNRVADRPIRKSFEFGARTIRWSADDPDQDRLRFAVEIRREPAGDWFPLVDDLEREFHSWDARSLPDGTYRARLTADDRSDNSPERALRHRTVSEPFRVDNTRPLLEAPEMSRENGAFLVRFTARDPGGRVEAVEVAINGAPWTVVAPLDGVADSSVEDYEVSMPATGDGDAAGSLRVRVTDRAGNQGGDLWRVEDPRARR